MNIFINCHKGSKFLACSKNTFIFFFSLSSGITDPVYINVIPSPLVILMQKAYKNVIKHVR